MDIKNKWFIFDEKLTIKKRIMKKFLKNILDFGRVKKRVEENPVSKPTPKEIRWTIPIVPAHNNRKNPRGRFTQYVPFKDGTFRAIYHGAKS